MREPKDIIIKGQRLDEILADHALWINSKGDSGIRANLSDLDLSDINLQFANLQNVIARNTNLQDANLFEANIWAADFRNSFLKDANLKKANLREVNFKEANLQSAISVQADFSNADLYRANLRNANLQHAVLFRANLAWADLRDATLSNADLSWANFERSKLTRTNFSNSILLYTDFSDCTINDSLLTGAIFVRTLTFGWDLNDIHCEYIFSDLNKIRRYPIDRNFEPGEFEKTYPKVPTFEEKAALSHEIAELQKRLHELERFNKEAANSGGVFISYSHDDKDVIDLIVNRFQETGIVYWLDDKDMLVGQVIDKAISEGIQKCWLFLILLTPTSISSKWVEREFDEASHAEIVGKKVILPVMAKKLDIQKLPSRIGHKLCADLSTNFEAGYARLLNSINSYLQDFEHKALK